MTDTTIHHPIRRVLGGVAIAALVAGTAISVAPRADGTLGFGGSVAEAAPGGNGKGQGNGAANGNGGNSANAGANASAGAASGSNGLGKGNAFGRTGETDSDIAGAHPSDLGRLNAAHASPTARANAAPNSAVGQIASYERDVQEGDLESAAASFAEAANKDIVEPVVHAVNQLLGIDDAPVRSGETADSDEGAGEDGLGLGGLFDGITVHDTEGEIAARANGTWSPREDGDTSVPTQAHDT